MRRVGDSFLTFLRSPHSAPNVGRPIRLRLQPHAFGGYVLEVIGEGDGNDDCLREGFATAGDLRELSAMFAAAADVLAAKAAA